MGEDLCSTATDEAHVLVMPSVLTCALLVMGFIDHSAYMIQKLTVLHIPVMPRACEVSSLEYSHQLQDAQQLRRHVQSALHPAAFPGSRISSSATLQTQTHAGKARDLRDARSHYHAMRHNYNVRMVHSESQSKQATAAHFPAIAAGKRSSADSRCMQ